MVVLLEELVEGFEDHLGFGFVEVAGEVFGEGLGQFGGQLFGVLLLFVGTLVGGFDELVVVRQSLDRNVELFQVWFQDLQVVRLEFPAILLYLQVQTLDVLNCLRLTLRW